MKPVINILHSGFCLWDQIQLPALRPLFSGPKPLNELAASDQFLVKTWHAQRSITAVRSNKTKLKHLGHPEHVGFRCEHICFGSVSVYLSLLQYFTADWSKELNKVENPDYCCLFVFVLMLNFCCFFIFPQLWASHFKILIHKCDIYIYIYIT